MAQILLLLTMAMNLLVAAQAPNVPQSLRDTAVKVANYAIQVANKTLAEATTTTPVVSAPAPEPQLGALPQSTPAFVPMPQPAQPPQPTPQPVIVYVPTPQPEVKKELKIAMEGCQGREIENTGCQVSVFYSENGIRISDIPVTLIGNDGFNQVKNTARNTYDGTASADFFYHLSTTTPRTIFTATANGLTATMDYLWFNPDRYK